MWKIFLAPLIYALALSPANAYAKVERRSIYLTSNTLEMGQQYFALDRYSLGLTDSTLLTVWSPITFLLARNISILQRVSLPKEYLSIAAGATYINLFSKSPEDSLLLIGVATFGTKSQDFSIGGMSLFQDRKITASNETLGRRGCLFALTNSETSNDNDCALIQTSTIFWFDYTRYYSRLRWFTSVFFNTTGSQKIQTFPAALFGTVLLFTNWELRLSAAYVKNDELASNILPNPSFFAYITD